MLIGIIKEKQYDDNYYIHLNKKDDYNELSIIHVNNDIIEFLPRNKAKDLLKTLLSSRITYKEKENDYDIYLDEANNKRYFKNGKENYFMFLEHNGLDAVKYITKKSKLDLNKSYQIIAGGLIFTVFFSTVAISCLAFNDIKYKDDSSYLLAIDNPITVNEMIDLVIDSPHLNIDERELLCNEIFFSFVLENSEGKPRTYHLREALTNINIKSFNAEEFKGALGYYNNTSINTIHVLNNIDKNKEQYNDVVAHEFVHLMQDQNKYYYIIEASAEMMEYEFFDQPCDGYTDMVRRVKVLMDIVGPQPVIECNFKGNTTSFENSIKQYLSEEDANKMLELLSTPATEIYKTKEKTNKVNTGIDELLGKMYKNKTGKNIKDDILIQQIYNTNPVNRVYFNPNKAEYYENFLLPSKRININEIDMEDALNSNSIKYFQYSQRVSKIVGDNKYKYYQSQITKDISKVPTGHNKYVTIMFNDETMGTAMFDIEKGKWSKITHYKLINQYAPPIPEKFPTQARNPYEFGEDDEEKIEVKSM